MSSSSEPRRVRVFFYGSFINADVLVKGGFPAEDLEVAKLAGFDLVIGPLANVVSSPRGCVYGVLASGTHAELETLYGQGWVGTYLPEAVVVETEAGLLAPALCYISPPRPKEAPAADYVERIAGPARRLGFPDWYVERIESFCP